jgi:hypothetical protein
MQWDEVEELACLMLGKDYDSIVDNYEEPIIDDMFYEEYNVTLEDFEYLLKDLVKFTNPWKSPITEEICQGFVIPENDKGLMRAVIKEKYNGKN